MEPMGKVLQSLPRNALAAGSASSFAQFSMTAYPMPIEAASKL